MTARTPMPSRQQLEGLKRTELQALAKEYGVRGNIKNDLIIEQLLAEVQPPSPPAKPSRSSSMIIHDVGEEEEPQEPEPEPKPETPPIPTRSIRKSKDAQLKLGVGRPTAIGGAGARKSTSVSKLRKAKASANATQETIHEEEPHLSPEPSAAQAGPSHTSPDEIETQLAHTPISSQIQTQLNNLHQQISSINALQTQVNTLTRALESFKTQTQAQSSEIELLRDEVTDLRGIVLTFQTQLPDAARASGSRLPSSTLNISHHSSSSGTAIGEGSGTTAHPKPHPGLAPKLLGKRHRDDSISAMSGVFDDDVADEENPDEANEQSKVLRPTKKKPKLAPRVHPSSSVADENEGNQMESEVSLAPRIPSFTVFSDPTDPDAPSSDIVNQYFDPPPPTNHLPDFFAPSTSPTVPALPSPAVNSRAAKIRASENQNQNINPQQLNFAGGGFNFFPTHQTSLQTPLESTPLGGGSSSGDPFPAGIGMPSFPYPEPPTSPSPAGHAGGGGFGFGSASDHQPFNFGTTGGGAATTRGTGGFGGLGHGRRPATRPNPNPHTMTSGSSINPSLLSHDRDMSAHAPALDENTGQPSRKTMYGTELDEDTRFGDFGREGVASGFWPGGKF